MEDGVQLDCACVSVCVFVDARSQVHWQIPFGEG